MADELKNDGITNLEDEEVENVAGGWAGSDKFTKREYLAAGVKWSHHIIGPDLYFYNGNQITQEEAESIAEEYFKKLESSGS